jgi:type I restriction enzyme S subunit
MSNETKKTALPKLRFLEFREAGQWKEKQLGEVAEIVTGNTPSTTDSENYGGEKPFVSPADITGERYITRTKTTLSNKGYSKTRHVKANSILFVCIGSTIGKVAQNKIECATNQQINAVIPNEINSSDFIFSALENNSSKIANLAGRHAVPIINKSSFSAVTMFFPSLEEQHKIATTLSSLDDLITAQFSKLAALQTHKLGLMQGLFPSEGETVPKLRFPEFKNSEKWQEKKLGELLEFRNGINASKEQYGTGVKFINVMDILNNEFITHDIIIGSVNVSSEIASNFSVSYGDILFQRSSETQEEVGTANVYLDKKKTATFGGFVIRGKKIGDYEPIFLNKLLKTQAVRNSISSRSGGSTRYNVGQEILASVKLLLPSPSEQKKIADCLYSLDNRIAAQNQKIEALKLHKKGLMQDLFPAAAESIIVAVESII